MIDNDLKINAMKKLTFLFLTLFSFALVNAQITMTMKSHGLNVGDAHEFILAKAVEEGPAGANMIWDFSDLEPNSKELTSYMLNPSETEKGKEIKKANTVLQEWGNQFFFKVNGKAIEQYGTAACNSLITYDQPFVKMKYPFTYGDAFYGPFSGKVTSANNSVTEFKGTYNVESDGFGTLILPGDVEIDNVLRVKTERTRIYANMSESKVITYRWYAANCRYPVLVIIKHETASKSYTSTVAYHAQPEKLKSAPLSQTSLYADEGSTFDVYPNPYKDVVNVKYNLANQGNVTIALYDNLGRHVKTLLENQPQEAGMHVYTFSTKQHDFKSGLYFLKIQNGDNSRIKKIIEMD